jgi:hypothetical protein
MSYGSTAKAFGAINEALEAKYACNDPIKMVVDGRPDFRIITLNPHQREAYDGASDIVGIMALRSFVYERDGEGGVDVWAALEAAPGGECFGFDMSRTGPLYVPGFLNGIVVQCGLQRSIPKFV